MAKDPNEMDAYELRAYIDVQASQLTAAQRRLTALERQCQHDWSPAVDASIYHKAYRIEGDKPGTMGVDWRGPMDVPASTERRWSRRCRKCGKVEFTTSTNKTTTETPRF